MKADLAMLARTPWPSLRRALASIFSLFAFPFFLMALVSAAKLFAALGWIELYGWVATVVEFQAEIVEIARRHLADWGLAIPAEAIDLFVIYFFFGSAISQAEADELLAVTLEGDERRDALRAAFTRGRLDMLFLAIPMLVRAFFLRLLWPLVALYRVRTPFVVEGPGPGGDEISTSVRLRDSASFRAMLIENGVWAASTVYDHRQVTIWLIQLSAAATLASNLAAGAMLSGG